ncbi:MAG TPA: cytochrome P450 [Pyrinomonadaceae bacterium]|jgi:cytochrome P450|nr:cytochrome P450 [Pyrinomonadaceae bacterium]
MLEQQNTGPLLALSEVNLAREPAVGPAPKPLLGYFPEQLKFGRDPLGYLTNVYRDYGGVSAWGGNKPSFVFSFLPNLNELVCDADQFDWAQKPMGHSPTATAMDVLSSGLLRKNGEEYKVGRRFLRTAFNQKLMEGWRESMVVLTRRMLDNWKDGQEIDLHKEIRRLVISISISTVFGVQDPEAARTLDDLISKLYLTGARPTTLLLPFNFPGSSYRKMLEVTDQLVTVMKGLIQEARRNECMLGMVADAKDENGVGLTDTELIGEAFQLMNLDNPIGGITWALFLLVQHPSVHADALDEMDSVLHGEEPTFDQLGNLPLLERAIKESLRLMPPFAFARRYAAGVCQLGPIQLSAGCRTIFSPYITHRMPEIYSEPLRYLPARWEKIRPSQYEYLPFGAGSHFCLGMRFAMLEMKIVLSSIIQRYRLTVQPNARIDRVVRITIQSKRGLPMRINRQDRKFRRNPIVGNIHEMVTFA